MKATINAKGTEITILSKGDDNDFISLTDIARYKNPEFPADVVKNWMRNRSTIEFLGLWEQLNNPDFKLVEFDQFKSEAGANAFVLNPQKWIAATNAVGMLSKSGRYGGTFAHKDVAFEFASWVSAEFKLYIIKDYQRLKSDENSRISLEWSVNRVISKINYKIHTDAIRDNLIPKLVYIADDGQVIANHSEVKTLLDLVRSGCKGQAEPIQAVCRLFNQQSDEGRNMKACSGLLSAAIRSMIDVKAEKDVDSLFSGGRTTALVNTIAGLDDFELIAFLVVQGEK